MTSLLKVCLISITLTLNGTSLLTAQSTSNDVPALQKGISVDLPRTISAISVPQADKEDALVVTITHNGSAYLGRNPICIAELRQQLKEALSTGSEKNVYIKADARVPYATLVSVLDSLHAAGIEGVTLLTSQSGAPAAGTVVSPKGLAIQIVSPGVTGRSSNLY